MVAFTEVGGEGWHGDVLTYRETESDNGRLVMVIGREANTNRRIEHVIAHYDFDEHPHCDFWNQSYTMAADVLGETRRGLMERCYDLQVAPVLYADALPIGIPSSVKKKRPLRKCVPDEKITRHIEGVFAHETIVGRIGLVVMSGLVDRPVFSRSVTAIRSQCRHRNIPVVALPFFSWRNQNQFPAALKRQPREAAILTDILQDFAAR
jgi:hypothetical protein